MPGFSFKNYNGRWYFPNEFLCYFISYAIGFDIHLLNLQIFSADDRKNITLSEYGYKQKPILTFPGISLNKYEIEKHFTQTLHALERYMRIFPAMYQHFWKTEQLIRNLLK